MQTLAVDENNELYVGAKNSLVMATGDEAVSQTCARAASTNKKELQYAQKEGVDYMNTVFSYGSVASAGLYRSLFKELSNVTGVNNVSDLQVFFDPSTNQVIYTAVIITDNGAITL
jgi:hypothetical protein